jgi:uncharacterized cupredoxin-like copper-binding protein
MHRKRSKMAVVASLATCCLGLGAWLVVAAGPAAGQVATQHSAKVTVVNVTLGQPSELGIKFSKWSAIPAGVVTFKVTNKGDITHNFKICTTVVLSSKANVCVGKTTPNLASGKSAVLTVKLSKPGKYLFLCSLPGHAAGGMKGLIGVGVKVPVPTSQVTTTGNNVGGTTTTKSTTTTTATGGCASPKNTSVDVNMFDYGFTLSAGSVPCGRVTFTERNTGMVEHNFNIVGLAMAVINPGQSSTSTFTLSPGTARYICDVPGHEGLGMVGTLTVTA